MGTIKTADKKPQVYTDPVTGKRKVRMVAVDQQIVKSESAAKTGLPTGQSTVDYENSIQKLMKTLKKDPMHKRKSGNELRKLATLKLTGHKLKESVELDEAIDFRKAFMDIQSYAKKSGGMDKTDFEKVAHYVKTIGDNQNTPNVANKAFMAMKKHIAGLDTDVRDGIHVLLKKHGMVKNGRMVQESVELDEVWRKQSGFMPTKRVNTSSAKYKEAEAEYEREKEFLQKQKQQKPVKKESNTQYPSHYTQDDKDISDKMRKHIKIKKKSDISVADYKKKTGMKNISLKHLTKNTHIDPFREDKEETFAEGVVARSRSDDQTSIDVAKKIAKDHAGNMTGAVKKIEKIKKGLSDHPQVQKHLRLHNEDIDSVSEKKDLEELSPQTKKSYLDKSQGDAERHASISKDYATRKSDGIPGMSQWTKKMATAHDRKSKNRAIGQARAAEQVEESNVNNEAGYKVPKNYTAMMAKKKKNQDGESMAAKKITKNPKVKVHATEASGEPTGLIIHMKHKETGKVVKSIHPGTHMAVRDAKAHISGMQKKGYEVHKKELQF